MNKKLIYIACPHAHKDEKVRQKRIEVATKAAAYFMKKDDFVFSPLTHNTPLLKYGLNLGWKFWEKYDGLMITKCDSMVVLKLEGWKTSKGVQAEIELAKRLEIPIKYFEEKDLD